MKSWQRWVSLVVVLILALLLPTAVKLANSAVKLLAGAEGRLAAIAVETNHPLGPLPMPWKGMAQGADSLKNFLDGNETAVADLDLEYIRIDHIYDQFNVIERQGRDLTFNWSELDKLVDKITGVGAKPFFSLSYMPIAISVKTDLDEPRSWKEWSLVVQKTVEHFSGERGLDGMYYEVWNEPDLFGKWTMGGKKDYRNLYYYAAKGAGAAKKVKAFKIGGPATTGLYRSWMDNFFPFILSNNVRLDFFSWHRYDLNVDKYVQDVSDVNVWLDKHPYFSHVEKIVSEMGPTSEMGKENDTHVGAAHLVVVMRELLAKIKYGFTFAVSGNWGIINKPRYEAFRLLSKLGPERLGVSGEGSWVRAIGAKSGDKFQVLVVNYDPEEQHSEQVPISFINLKKPGAYILKTSYFRGEETSQEVATSGAVLQKEIYLTANSMVLIELEAKR